MSICVLVFASFVVSCRRTCPRCGGIKGENISFWRPQQFSSNETRTTVAKKQLAVARGKRTSAIRCGRGGSIDAGYLTIPGTRSSAAVQVPEQPKDPSSFGQPPIVDRACYAGTIEQFPICPLPAGTNRGRGFRFLFLLRLSPFHSRALPEVPTQVHLPSQVPAIQ